MPSMSAFHLSTIDCRAFLPRCRCVVRISLVMPNNVDDGGAHKYQRQWQAYRRRRSRLAVLLIAEFMAFFPFLILVATVEKGLFSTNKAVFPATLLWGAVYLFTGSRLRNFPCPRSGKNFFGGYFAKIDNVLGQKCANCGLRRYAEE